MSEKYRVEIRRYTVDGDDDTEEGFHGILAVHDFIAGQVRFGPFRCWVNGKAVKNAYHGASLEELMAAVDPVAAAMTEAALAAVAPLLRVPTNPATYRAVGGGL